MNHPATMKSQAGWLPAKYARRCLIALHGACWLLAAEQALMAQDSVLMRWQLEPGQKLAVHVVHTRQTQLTQEDSTKTFDWEINLDLTWTVSAVDANKHATIRQSVDHLIVDLKPETALPHGHFDSNMPDAKTDLPEPVRRVLAIIAKSDLTFTVNPLGQVLDLQVPAETTELIAAETAGQQVSSVFTPAGFLALTGMNLCELPAVAAKPGHTWQAERPFEDLVAGSRKMTYHHTYQGPVEEAGGTLHKVDLNLELAITPDQKPVVGTQIKDQSATGTLLYDPIAAIVRRIQLSQNRSYLFTVGDKTIDATSQVDSEVEISRLE